MKAQEALSRLIYEGEARGSRQAYHIFRGPRHFLVLSFKKADRDAGNFNLIRSAAVNYTQAKFHGAKGITAKRLLEESRRTSHFKDRFSALNTLYVLVGLKKAIISSRPKAGALLFNIR